MKEKTNQHSVQDREKNKKRFEALSAEEQQRVLARREARRRRREQEVRRQKILLLGGGMLAVLILTVSLCVGIGKMISSANSESGRDQAVHSQQNNNAEEGGAAVENTDSKQEDAELLEKARRLAAMYDYDNAIAMLKKSSGYEANQEMQQAVTEFEETKATCKPWPIEQVTACVLSFSDQGSFQGLRW